MRERAWGSGEDGSLGVGEKGGEGGRGPMGGAEGRKE